MANATFDRGRGHGRGYRVERVDTSESWATAETLIREYAASLGLPLDFQNFDEEIAHLPREYGPPAGVFLLAREDDRIVGGGGVRRFSNDACEMKRLYVRPGAQGRGVGRAVAMGLIDDARRLGYRRMLLDTLPAMRAAQALYRSLGFRDTTAYRFNPIQGTTFLELTL